MPDIGEGPLEVFSCLHNYFASECHPKPTHMDESAGVGAGGGVEVEEENGPSWLQALPNYREPCRLDPGLATFTVVLR